MHTKLNSRTLGIEVETTSLVFENPLHVLRFYRTEMDMMRAEQFVGGRITTEF